MKFNSLIDTIEASVEDKLMQTKQTEQKEIGRIKISETQELVATLIDNEKLDLRIFVNSESYSGPTKRGIRFYLFDDNWQEFKRLIQRIEKVFEQLP